ncbi:MAG: hypothetical protein V1880_02945 [Patescibacteria group bacterium]
MKKIVFHISAQLAAQIEEAIERWGFVNKPEFFRYSAIEFLRNDAGLMPADDTLKEHARAIRRVHAHKSVREHRMSWYKKASEDESERKAHIYR